MNNSKISRSHNLKLAERGVWVSIAAYIFLSLLQLGVAQITNSASLLANGFNNVTDILGNIAIVIGLRIAKQSGSLFEIGCCTSNVSLLIE